MRHTADINPPGGVLSMAFNLGRKQAAMRCQLPQVLAHGSSNSAPCACWQGLAAGCTLKGHTSKGHHSCNAPHSSTSAVSPTRSQPPQVASQQLLCRTGHRK